MGVTVISLLFVLLLALDRVSSAPASAEIVNLPGLNSKLNFKQYGGYITVNEEQGRNLFYWFVESQSKPATDPLFLWMQGGPGCSSLFGFLTEHGPFQITPNLDVVLNPYTWNTQANIIYLESPSGVGFSYHNAGPFSTGDNETMSDAYIFLQKWFQLYPEYQGNDFYVSGESYGGHYVPQLSWTILQENKNATTKINLKGMLAGNPWTDDTIDTWSVPPFIFYHHLCSVPTFQAVVENCIDNTTAFEENPFYPILPTLNLLSTLNPPFFDFRPRRIMGDNQACNQAMQTMFDEVGDDINQYDIYYPCVTGAGLDCMNYTSETDFLNNPAVQAAIHAKKPVVPWSVCADVNFTQSWPSVLPIYPELMDSIKVTVYSGDVTFNVPALGTEIWVENFQRTVKQDYQAWYLPNSQQVAGYYKKFDGITYVTAKDSGHMVPTFTPAIGKGVLDGFLSGQF